jgi:hypothetical protein
MSTQKPLNFLPHTPFRERVRKVAGVQHKGVFTRFDEVRGDLIPSKCARARNDKWLCRWRDYDLAAGLSVVCTQHRCGSLPQHAQTVAEDWHKVGRDMAHLKIHYEHISVVRNVNMGAPTAVRSRRAHHPRPQ